LSHALVDLGVCYYNLGDTPEAERHFTLALRRDPHHPVALFNLGIVHERRSEWERALEYFHRALQSQPPEAMREPLMEAMARVQEKTGKQAAPLPDGR
jgi:tetratricopeptide (TPR) repeat protein